MIRILMPDRAEQRRFKAEYEILGSDLGSVTPGYIIFQLDSICFTIGGNTFVCDSGNSLATIGAKVRSLLKVSNPSKH